MYVKNEFIKKFPRFRNAVTLRTNLIDEDVRFWKVRDDAYKNVKKRRKRF